MPTDESLSFLPHVALGMFTARLTSPRAPPRRTNRTKRKDQEMLATGGGGEVLKCIDQPNTLHSEAQGSVNNTPPHPRELPMNFRLSCPQRRQPKITRQQHERQKSKQRKEGKSEDSDSKENRVKIFQNYNSYIHSFTKQEQWVHPSSGNIKTLIADMKN